MTKGTAILIAGVLISLLIAIIFGVEAVRCTPPCI